MKRYTILLAILIALFSLSCTSNPNAETQSQGENGNQASRDVESSKDYSVDLGNGVELEMVWIPGGTFLIGSPLSEAGSQDVERPQTEVTLDGFWMGKYEVTQEQYEAIIDENPSRFEGDDQPVDLVSWFDAMDFCEALSDLTGHNFTLPTEAQWEYACRAGSPDAYCYGNDPGQLGTYAWYGEDYDWERENHTVGDREPNDFGLYDMHGNIYEWCLSLYDDYEDYDDNDGRNSLNNTTSPRILRGGSWYDLPEHCRSASRGWSSPQDRVAMGGFRCVRTR